MWHDPKLDRWRQTPTDRCWWCGGKATTAEHRIKKSTLRRIALHEGTATPENIFKKSGDHEGPLRSITKGSQVKWPKNLCAPCNNARSQRFDLAYDKFEAFVVEHADEMGRWRQLDWAAVYGDNWQPGARDLARYFAKQFGCMLAGQDLAVPHDVIQFLNGSDRCPTVCFTINLNWRAINFHKTIRRHGSAEGLTTFVGLMASQGQVADDEIVGIDYRYHIGYVWIIVDWQADSDRSSWFEHPRINLPRVYATVRDRLKWLPHRLSSEARYVWGKLDESQ